MMPAKGDVEEQVTNYFHLCNSVIRMNGLSSLFASENGAKKKCKILVQRLPVDLQKRVLNEIEFRVPGAKLSVPKLFNLVNELAHDLEKEQRAVRNATRGMKRAAPETPRANGSGSRGTQPTGQRNRGPPHKMRSAESKGVSVKSEPTRQARTTGARTTQSWSCGGAHRLADCPTTFAKDRDEVMQRVRRRHGGAKRD